MTFAEEERSGHAVRHFPLALSTTALALAWARQEGAPHGSVVVADREVSPLGRHGRLWAVPPEATFSCAVVTRPVLSAEEGDAVWLLGGLLAIRAIDRIEVIGAGVDGEPTAPAWWPDRVVSPATGAEIVMVKADIQLRPGQVASAVITLRFDLRGIAQAGSPPAQPGDILDSLLAAADELGGDQLGADADGGIGLAAAYERRCALLGRRIKAALLPKGETRGVARAIDRYARLEVASATGMVEPIAIDSVRRLEVVP